MKFYDGDSFRYAGPSGHIVWGVGLDRLDAESMVSNAT
jgi:hypothetical protein